MTTANKTAAAKKSAPNAVVGKAVSDKLKAGQEPKAPAPELKQADKLANKRLSEITDEVCVSAMEKALGFGKAALHIECAIALAIFATDKVGVNKYTKNRVMEVYKKAGYNVSPAGDDYKTCNRRMNVFSNFFTKIGAPKVQEMMDGAKEAKAIEALKNFLTTEYNFKGVNDIIEAATGKKPKQTNTPAAREQRIAKDVAGSTPMPAAAPVTPEGQHLNIDGTPDKRSAPEGEIAESQKTRAEHGLQGTSKAAAQPTPADQAVMSQMGEAAQERNQANPDAPKHGRRGVDRGILLVAGKLELAIPYGTSGKDIQDMFTKLAVLQMNLRDDTIVDEKFDRYSDSPRNQATQQATH